MKKIFILSFLVIFNTRAIDTIDEANKGNWYEKLNWWKKSKPKYESLSKLLTNIKEDKKDLENRYKKISSKFDEFIKNLNIDQDLILKKIDQKLAELNTQIEQEYEQDDQDMLNTSTEVKNNIEKLKIDFKALVFAKSNLDKSIEYNLENQIQLAENYEETALHSFEQIENVLDDKKAKALYETIENANENIAIIKNYISIDLKNYISESEIKINQLESKVENSIKKLESKNVYLIEKINKQKDAEKEKKEIKDESEKKSYLTWYKKLYIKISNFFKKIIDFFKSFFIKSEKK